MIFRPPAGRPDPQGQPRQPESALASVETTMTVSTDFSRDTGQFRTELLAYCYRMLGSADEAEDLVQETYLRAWRSYAGFEGRSSVRTWLYRIATNACLTAIDRRGRPSTAVRARRPWGRPGRARARPGPGVPWLQPMPKRAAGRRGGRPGRGRRLPGRPAAGSGRRVAVPVRPAARGADPARCAGLASPPRWRDLLGTSTTAVHSALRRARAQLADVLPAEHYGVRAGEARLSPGGARPVHGGVRARRRGRAARLLRDDVVLEMPPLLTWFAGRDDVGRILRRSGVPAEPVPDDRDHGQRAARHGRLSPRPRQRRVSGARGSPYSP